MISQRLCQLRRILEDEGIDVAVITDDDNVYYYTGYFDYLHMEFGRPTILVVNRDGKSLLITPRMERDMAEAVANVDHIETWNDGLGNEWREVLPSTLSGKGFVAIEKNRIPPLVRNYLDTIVDSRRLTNITPIIDSMRMIKSTEELQVARHAGQVAMAMMDAARATIGDGVREFEVALATASAGTRKAAELLEAHYGNSRMSPNTHFLQIMASGEDIVMPHHRATTRVMKRGDPVFMCFCGMTNFQRFKLGFDRTFWIGEIADTMQADVYQVALASQAAALKVLRPGITAEDVHAEYAEVIQTAGYEYPFRCGRATGYSFLESPELVFGDKTILKPGMVMAVDGSVSVAKSFRAQVGDSFILEDGGYEQITMHPNSLTEMIL